MEKSAVEGEGSVLGGYRLISVIELCMVWAAYRERSLRLVDLRTWIACQELAARRWKLKPGQKPRYSIEEIHRLVGGVGGKHIRSSLARLEAVGLLCWSQGEIKFGDNPSALHLRNPDALAAMLAKIANRRRKVPVPRRTLKLIAGGAKPALIAMILGHLLRCLYLRGGHCTTVGRLKVSWASSVFQMSERPLKAAKKHLFEIGWLQLLKSEQWQLNRWGGCVAVNLSWSQIRSWRKRFPKHGINRSAPLRPLSTIRSAPPESNKYLLSEYRNQNPASGGPAGARKRQGRPENPTLRHVVPEDLRDTRRLLGLFSQAVRAGIVKPTEAERLKFVAAAEHARVIGSRNPCGLFAELVRRGLWHFVTQSDEDAAARRLKAFLSPTQGVGKPTPVPFTERSRFVTPTSVGAVVKQLLRGISGAFGCPNTTRCLA